MVDVQALLGQAQMLMRESVRHEPELQNAAQESRESAPKR
jgi:hypothetical protein